MSLNIAIVGLPNVGKSTIFNALTKSKVPAENYPFCTIEPNVGCVVVPDIRVDRLTEKFNSAKKIYTTVNFVDIAGLVKGAAEGQGLGNKFLSNIRESDAICHILRHFNSSNTTHIEGRVSAKDDLDIIRLELILSDLEQVNKKYTTLEKETRHATAEREAKDLFEALKKIKPLLEANEVASGAELTEDEAMAIRSFGLLTLKPELFVLNVDQDQILKDKSELIKETGLELDPQKVVVICAKIESELADLSDTDALEFMNELGINESGLNQLIKAGYHTLNYITFLTSGEDETRAWTIVKGTLAPQAAGVIHTDFDKGFIRADVIAWDKLVEFGWVTGREKGLIKTVGKDYEVADGDVIIVYHN